MGQRTKRSTRWATALGTMLLLAAACSAPDTTATTPAGSRPSAAGTSVAPSTAPPGSTPATGASTPGTQPGVAPGGGAAWTTYHHDAARSGVDPSSPPATDVQQAWVSPDLDGAVYAEPLVFDGRVLVATENDSVYSLDAATGAIVWTVHLATPVNGSDLPCGNIDPSGITGTPVIDPANKTIWVVTNEAPSRHHLYELNLTDGSTVRERGADPPGADAKVHQQRAALSFANGTVYVPYGGLFGDCGDYHGWVVGFPDLGRGDVQSYVVPNQSEAGIWAPPGASIAGDGNLFVATGNGTSPDEFADGNAVVRLSPTLARQDAFAPANWKVLNSRDLDVGSVGPTLLPGGLVLQGGKEGIGYLLRADHLGGVGGQLFQGPLCRAFGGTAVDGSTVYVPCREGLAAVDVTPGDKPAFTVRWRTNEVAGPPIVAGGLVWSIDANGELGGFDPASGAKRFSFALGDEATSFPSPSAADGMLFAPAGAKVVAFRGV